MGKHRTHAQAVQLILTEYLHISPGPYPDDIVWKNMGCSRRLIDWRTAAVDALLAGGMLLWSIPVTLIQAVACLQALQLFLALPSVDDYATSQLMSVVMQYLPVLAWLCLLAIMHQLFYRIAKHYECVKTRSEAQLR